MRTRLSPTISHIRDGRKEDVMRNIVEFFAMGWGLPVEYSKRDISISKESAFAALVVLNKPMISMYSLGRMDERHTS